VIISRHGKPVAELRPILAHTHTATPATYAWLTARRQSRRGVGVTSVELLNKLYDDPEA
jgi:antitoxin (DNA-binding transcriptional repressor) of toxin-antitoxin stability system